MLKLIAVNYTVMLNGYSQWLNIKGEKQFYRDISTFTFMHLADAFIQSDLHCIQVSFYIFFLSAFAFPGNRTHDLGVASTMLYYLSYRKAVVVLISVMLAFNHKKDAIKEILKIYCLYVVCTFEDWMWNYCNIKVYLKTLMLGGINYDSF